MSIESLNRFYIGFSRDRMKTIYSHISDFKSLVIVDCEYGEIIRQIFTYQAKSLKYSLKFKSYEVDIDVEENSYGNEYVLKAALYHRDEIIGFENKISSNLREGLIEICEKMLDKQIRMSK